MSPLILAIRQARPNRRFTCPPATAKSLVQRVTLRRRIYGRMGGDSCASESRRWRFVIFWIRDFVMFGLFVSARRCASKLNSPSPWRADALRGNNFSSRKRSRPGFIRLDDRSIATEQEVESFSSSNSYDHHCDSFFISSIAQRTRSRGVRSVLARASSATRWASS